MYMRCAYMCIERERASRSWGSTARHANTCDREEVRTPKSWTRYVCIYIYICIGVMCICVCMCVYIYIYIYIHIRDWC